MAPRFEPGQVITIFRSRLRPEAVAEYGELAEEIERLARAAPGYVDHKTFVADDGERVTVVTFATAEQQRAWRQDPRHLAAQDRGRERLYAEYSIQVGDSTSAHSWSTGTGGHPPSG